MEIEKIGVPFGMPVAVLGGGSLGLLLAGRLKESGCDCILWTRTRDQASLLNREGLTMENQAGNVTHRIRIEASSLEEASLFVNGIVLLTVKQTALTASFIAGLATVIPVGGTLVLFQNGIGHHELLKEALPGRKLIMAITTEGALRLNPAAVRHTGAGDIQIGDDDETKKNELLSLERMLKQAGFSVYMSKKLEQAIIRKLLINSVINPLTAILRIRNGELTKSTDRMDLMKSIFLESFGILNELGIGDEAELWNTVIQVCASTGHNQSSMLQDVLAGKETEIDYINGAICRIAAKQGKPAPLNSTVTALVKAIY